MSSKKIVNGFKFALIYVDKLAPNQAFYEKYMGFEKTAEYGPGEIFGKMGDVDVWMGKDYWLKFIDPAGNIVEVLGGE